MQQQQPEYTEITMFQKLQELQRNQKQQPQGFADARQDDNFLNQFFANANQAASAQFPPLVNGSPVLGGSQMYMNWVQRGSSSSGQARNDFLQEQGLGQQRFDASLYGTPVASTRGNMGHQYSLFQEGGQGHKPALQSIGNQYPITQNQVRLPQGGFMSNNSYQGKHTIGMQGTFISGQHQPAWLEMQPKQSESLVPLDPIEEKILFNTDEGAWDASFGKFSDLGSEEFGNTLDNTDAFPSLQSGSWSALMQSAVGEASSSDTGIQEEWSGLTFQNTDPSNDNQVSNFIDSGREPTGWVDNNFPSGGPFITEPMPTLTSFQKQNNQISDEHRFYQDDSHEPSERFPKAVGNWIDCDPQRKKSNEESQHVQSYMDGDPSHRGEIYVRSTEVASKKEPELCEKQYDYYQRETSSDGRKSREQGPSAHFKLFGDGSASEMNLNKQLTTNEGSREPEKVSSRGDRRSSGSNELNLTDQTSQIRHETLRNHLRGSSIIPQIASSGPSFLTEMPNLFTQKQNDSSVSQGFGLRLAPPSQRTLNVNCFSQDLQQTPAHPNARKFSSEFGEKNQNWMASQFSVQPMPPSHSLSQRSNEGDNSTPLLKNQTHMQALFNSPRASQLEQATWPSTASRYSPLHQPNGQTASQENSTVSFLKKSTSQASPRNIWNNLPAQEHPPSLSISVDELDSNMVNLPNSSPSGLLHPHSRLAEINATRFTDNHSWKSPNNLHHNYSLFSQAQAMNNAETGATMRPLKTSNVPDVQQVDSILEQKLQEHHTRENMRTNRGMDSTSHLNALRDYQNVKPLSQQNVPGTPCPTAPLCQGQSSSSDMVSGHSEYDQVSILNAAAPWVKETGTSKTFQMPHMFDITLAKAVGGQLSIGNSENLHMRHTAQDINVGPSMVSNSAGGEQSITPYTTPSMIQSMAILGEKKRRSVTFEQVAWNIEVTGSSKRHRNISMAEQEWALATNSLTEKMGNDGRIEYLQRVPPSKRRLILTTQLMQQLFLPAPAVLLLADASSCYDTVSYVVSRKSLGDACSFLQSGRNDLLVPLDKTKTISGELKTFGSGGYELYSKVTEEFTEKAKRLEIKIESLDKVGSMVDIRVELQELEKFAAINRFAKFHSRALVDSSGNTSSALNTKPVPEKYVAALPYLVSIPEGVQCLSL